VRDLENLGTTPQESVLIETFSVQRNIGGSKLDRVLEERSTLAGKHSLVDNGGTFDQEHITSNTTILFGSVDRDEVAREKLVTLYLDPLAQTEHPHIVGLDAHATELVEGALTLPDDSTLEHDKHEEGKERIIPVLIKHPKSDTEYLEDEEWGDCVLLEELGEGGYRNIKSILAIVLLNSRQLGLGLDTLRSLEVADRRLGLDIDIVLEGRERLGSGVIEEASLLEEERSVELATSLQRRC
jgi:hypothetical protein